MDLTLILHTLTIVGSLVGIGLWTWKASVNAINQMQKEGQNAINQMQKEGQNAINQMQKETHNITNSIREDTKRHDAEFQETRKLWAELLQRINSKEAKS